MSIAYPSPSPRPESGRAPIRIMIVDDAVVVRGLLTRWIEAEPGLQTVGSMRSGREAIEQFERAKPDVVILDVDMPDTDGITALPRLLEKKRDLIVIMASTLTRRNAEISLRALALGAADYIPKPESTREITTSMSFRRELIDKIKALAARRRRTAPLIPAPVSAAVSALMAPPAPAHMVDRRDENTLQRVVSPSLVPIDEETLTLRPLPLMLPRVLLVGASTGGPQALNRFLASLGSMIDHVPVLVVQHMPPTFTTILAEHLTRAARRPVHEAIDGEEVRAGRIYVAPGGRHMRVMRRDGMATIALDDGPLINFCKPAVDPLFSSAAEIWGSKNLAVVLTGMGSDGTRGAATLVAAGGSVIAQDEDSSVVWGMPGSVANAGLCSAVLPLDQIAPKVVRLFSGDRS
ncbi:MAG: chemotaxis-specific protein-glutamate methyltransferase CheB [Rhizobiales bacterium]|nr:chemotaxis-specific protein-glutamate methyltransferase CheB [Hyphomicrobiales bacterium]